MLFLVDLKSSRAGYGHTPTLIVSFLHHRMTTSAPHHILRCSRVLELSALPTPPSSRRMCSPILLSTPRQIPLPLESKFVDSLQSLESGGNFHRVDEPKSNGMIVSVVILLTGTRLFSRTDTSCPPLIICWAKLAK